MFTRNLKAIIAISILAQIAIWGNTDVLAQCPPKCPSKKSAGSAIAQKKKTQAPQKIESKETQALPLKVQPTVAGDFGLPTHNNISAPYDEWRVYWKEKNKQTAKLESKMKVVSQDYKPKAGELMKLHKSLDIQSRAKPGADPSEIEYQTPVGGIVSRPDKLKPYNGVIVKTKNGGEVKFLHSSELYVPDGTEVQAGQPIGKTGKTGANAVHLHVEYRNPQGVYTEVKKVEYPDGGVKMVDSEEQVFADGGKKPVAMVLVDKKEFEARERNVKQIEDSMIASGSLKSRAKEAQAREQNIRKIENELGANRSIPPKLDNSTTNSKPGGVLFNKQVEMLNDLSDIHGAFYDSKSQRIVFVGESNIDAPAMDKNLLAVALRAVYSGEFPGVSIDPSSDPSVMKVRYLGRTENTRFGAIMFEADRILKALSRGEDNLTRLPVRPSVSGYQSISQRQVIETGREEGRSLYRLWFKPHKLSMRKTVDGNSIAFAEATMICDWENMQGVNPGPAVQSFVSHLNNNLISYADDQPILHEMLFLEKIVGLALWMRDQNIFLDPNLLGIENFETPATTPATTVTSTIRTGQSIWTLTSTGGVDLSLSTPYVPDSDRVAFQLKEAALMSRPRADMVSWDFKLNDRYLTAVALPVGYRPLRSGPITSRISIAAPGQPAITNFQIDQSDESLTMTISGSNFGAKDQSSQVLVNGTPVTIKLWSDTKIIIVLPPEEATEYSVTVSRKSARSSPLLLRGTPDPVAIIRKVRSSQYSSLPPLATNNSGRGEESGITVQNNTPYALRVYLAGPVVQWFNLPAGQSSTLNLKVGNYEAAIKASGGNVMPLYSVWQISPNTRYTLRLLIR